MADLGAHFVVCGLNDVSIRIVEELRLGGERVVILDDAAEPALASVATELGAQHLPLNGRREYALRAAGIDTAAALICTAPTDLENLEIALLTRRLRADLRVVVQLGNPALGRGMARVTGPASVLDVAALAAPTLAEACLDLQYRLFQVGDESFALGEFVADQTGTLRSLFGDLVPVAVVPHDGSEMALCPGRDLPISAGDRVVLLATEDDMAEQSGTDAVHPAERRRRRHGKAASTIGTMRRYARGFIAESERPMRVTLGILLAVATVSIVLLRIGYHRAGGGRMTVLDSAYFTTETLTTVGFGDFYFGNQSGWLRGWAIALMVFGATLVTILYAMLTNLLVSRRIAQSLGRQLATRMHDHVIVIGLGTVGLRVVEYLVARGHQVVVLDRDEDNRFLARARELRVPVVIGDATVQASLEAVNLRRARAVAVLTSSDLANIETALTIDDLLGDLRPEVPLVLRVFDRDLAQTIETGFGFHTVRSTSELAAPWFVGAALGLDIHSTFYVDHEPMLMGRLTVAEQGGLAGRTMEDLAARVRVIAIRRCNADGRLEYPPRRETRFAGGDQAYLVGPVTDLLAVLRRDAGQG